MNDFATMYERDNAMTEAVALYARFEKRFPRPFKTCDTLTIAPERAQAWDKLYGKSAQTFKVIACYPGICASCWMVVAQGSDNADIYTADSGYFQN